MTATSNELTILPCPFCGAPALEGPLWPKHYGCSDSECGAHMANLSVPQWNRRPVPETCADATIPALPYPGDEEALRQFVKGSVPFCTCIERSNDDPHRKNCPFWLTILAARGSWMNRNIAAWSCSMEARGRERCTQWCGNPGLCTAVGNSSAQNGPDAAADVLAERRRQVTEEGWTPAHDDAHSNFELSAAAACYALRAPLPHDHDDLGVPMQWPWSQEWWKPKGPRSDLVRAGALILAEIERIDRDFAKNG